MNTLHSNTGGGCYTGNDIFVFIVNKFTAVANFPQFFKKSILAVALFNSVPSQAFWSDIVQGLAALSEFNRKNRADTWEYFMGSDTSDNNGYYIGTSRYDTTVLEEDSVGGGFDTVIGVPAELRQLVDIIKNPKKYTDLGISVPKGILMYGPPGTGKTALARALTAEIPGARFISKAGSSFVELYVGQGPARVRELFNEARHLIARGATAVIIFIDEIDAIGKRGEASGGGSHEYANTINELLAQMDGVEKNGNARIFVVGTTNRLDNLDVALRRPGRFDWLVPVGLPTAESRAAILKLYLAKTRHVITPEMLTYLVANTEHWSGAELEALVREAGMQAAAAEATEIADQHIKAAYLKCSTSRGLRR